MGALGGDDMNTKRTLLTIALLWIFTLTAAVAAPASQYSATIVATNGGQSKTSKQYMDHGKMRTEMNQGGQTVISIVRPDKKVIWNLLVAQKMYMEIPISGPARTGAAALPPDATYAKVGSETVEGKPTDKYRIDVKGKPVGFVWLAGQNIAKYQTADGATTVIFRDFKAGPQPAALFELPAGYRKLPAQKP